MLALGADGHRPHDQRSRAVLGLDRLVQRGHRDVLGVPRPAVEVLAQRIERLVVDDAWTRGGTPVTIVCATDT